MKKGTICFIVLCLLVGNVFAGEKELKEKLKNLQEEEKKGQKIVVDDLLRRELHEFLEKNQGVSVKNSKKFRLTAKASGMIIRDLNKKYGAKEDNYQEKIKDRNERHIYRTALRILQKDYYKNFYICKGEDEKKVKESWGKVDEIRTQLAEKLQKESGFENSDEAIRLREQILKECRFEGAEYALLDSYRIRGEKNEKYREKFNNLMLRMIADDQINYDYLYKGLDYLNTSFISQYLLFLQQVNSRHEKLILSKEQIKFMAENTLDKHREVFNLRSSSYYSEKTGRYDTYAVSDAVQSMVNLSTWLKHYKLDDLNEKIIKWFFDDEYVMTTMRYTPWFKDFWEYLIKREDFEKYKEE